MGIFTFIPVWIIQDVLIYTIAVITLLYILKQEEHPASILLEFITFIFFYAAVYENFATIMGWYGYGSSLLMIFNVPVSVPVFEYLIVYAALRLMKTMKMPTWSKPFIAGFFGVLADFSLDPVALKQVFVTFERTIGRWTWYPAPGDVQIYSEPVYNFSGWMLLCGWAAALLLLGRFWYKKSGFKPWVGYLYPVLAMLVSLGLLCSPVSNLLLWLGPFFAKGSFTEYIMLAFHLIVPVVLLLTVWKGVMQQRLLFKQDFPLFLILIGFHIINIFFCILGAYWDIFWLVTLAGVVHSSLVLFIYYRSRKIQPGSPA